MNKNERKAANSKRMQMKETKHRSLRWLHKIRRIVTVFQIMDLASAMDVILSFFLATLTNSMQTSPAAAPSTRRAPPISFSQCHERKSVPRQIKPQIGYGTMPSCPLMTEIHCEIVENTHNSRLY